MAILFCLLMATPFEDGSQALLRSDWQGAVVAFTKAIETKPTSRAYVNRGIAYGMLGNDKAAFDDYTTAIKLNPSEPFATPTGAGCTRRPICRTRRWRISTRRWS
jgi:Flp pilus assembly protein TadD